MNRTSRIGVIALVMLVCTGCDQVTKGIAQRSLSDQPPVSLLNGLIRFEYLENPGATLGLGAALSPDVRQMIFVVAASAFTAVLLVFALKSKALSPTSVIGLSLAAAGGLGNLIDRVMNNGAVIDFVSFGVGTLRTGVMNVADVAIFAGMALVLIDRTRRDEPTST